MGALGIKETKELLVAADEVALVVVANIKNGVGGEFTAFYEKLTTDPEFKAKLQAAWDKHAEIPAEMGDIDVGEGLELAMLEISYIPKFLAALGK